MVKNPKIIYRNVKEQRKEMKLQKVTTQEKEDVLSERELNAAELSVQFKNLVREKVKREGVEELLNYLDSTDFFEAPASTRYHLCEAGGLVQHSLNVYENLVKVIEFLKSFDSTIELKEESIVLTALFHDLCKADKYEKGTRNVKNPDTGKWEQVPVYNYREDAYEIGHGAGSALLLQQYIKLTPEEIQAIVWHMGAFDLSPYSSVSALSKAYSTNILAFALQQADMIATYVTEKE